MSVDMCRRLLGIVAILALLSGEEKGARRTEEPEASPAVTVTVPAPKVEYRSPEERRREEAACLVRR